MQIREIDLHLPADFPFVLDKNTIQQSKEGEPVFHWHKSIEISYIESGACCYFVGEHSFLMKPGDIILFNAYEPHGWQSASSNDPLVYSFSFAPSLIYGGQANLFDYSYLRFFEEKSTNFCNKLPCAHPATAQIRQIYLEMIEEYEKKEYGYELMLKAKLLALITLLIRHFQDHSKTMQNARLKEKNLERLQSALDYLNDHFTQDIRLQDVAGIACMNSSYFSTFFHENLGISFKEYLTKRRLQHAMQLLDTTHQSIVEIALDSGFHSLSSYYKACKKYALHPQKKSVF